MIKKKRTEQFYRRLAGDLENFIKRLIQEGRELVYYKEIFDEFGIDRFTCSIALGWLVKINTENGYPLMSSLVVRKEDKICGKGFWWAADDNGYTYDDALEFMLEQMRKAIAFIKAKV